MTLQSPILIALEQAKAAEAEAMRAYERLADRVERARDALEDAQEARSRAYEAHREALIALAVAREAAFPKDEA